MSAEMAVGSAEDLLTESVSNSEYDRESVENIIHAIFGNSKLSVRIRTNKLPLEWRSIIPLARKGIGEHISYFPELRSFWKRKRLMALVDEDAISAIVEIWNVITAERDPAIEERRLDAPLGLTIKLLLHSAAMKIEANRAQKSESRERKLQDIRQQYVHEWLQAEDARVDIPNGDFPTWLSRQTPDVWHAVLTNWNYDYGTEGHEWVVKQRTCDKATAALIYFLQFSDIGYENAEIASGDLVKLRPSFVDTIAKNWANGFYRSEEFSADTGRDRRLCRRFLQSLGANGAKLAYPMPEDAWRDFIGREPNSEYCSGDGYISLTQDAWLKKRGLWPLD